MNSCGSRCLQAVIKCCDRSHDGLHCTLPLGHDGPHIACGTIHNMATWMGTELLEITPYMGMYGTIFRGKRYTVSDIRCHKAFAGFVFADGSISNDFLSNGCEIATHVKVLR